MLGANQGDAGRSNPAKEGEKAQGVGLSSAVICFPVFLSVCSACKCRVLADIIQENRKDLRVELGSSSPLHLPKGFFEVHRWMV